MARSILMELPTECRRVWRTDTGAGNSRHRNSDRVKTITPAFAATTFPVNENGAGVAGLPSAIATSSARTTSAYHANVPSATRTRSVTRPGNAAVTTTTTAARKGRRPIVCGAVRSTFPAQAATRRAYAPTMSVFHATDITEHAPIAAKTPGVSHGDLSTASPSGALSTDPQSGTWSAVQRGRVSRPARGES